MIVGLNLVGLRRNGYGPAEIAQLKAAYRLIYRQGLRWNEILERLKQEYTSGPAADFHPFLSQGTRGFVQERRMPPNATLKLRRVSDDDLITARANSACQKQGDGRHGVPRQSLGARARLSAGERNFRIGSKSG